MNNSREATIEGIIGCGIVAIIRLKQPSDLVQLIQAVRQGGVPAVEVTTNTPGYLEAVQEVNEKYPDIFVGVGTVTNPSQAKEAIEAGANYLVTPITSKEIVQKAKDHGVPVVMGAFSPTEIHMAHQYGADFIKLFPADVGVSYLKAVKATLPEVRFIPTGGITLENCHTWIESGVAALGIGSSLISKSAFEQKDYDSISRTVAEYKEAVDQSRLKLLMEP